MNTTTNDLLIIFSLGLLNGLTVCSFVCLPGLAIYSMGMGGGFQSGVQDALAFVVGKILTCGFLTGLAAYLGREFIFTGTERLKPIFGFLLIFVGLSILTRKEKTVCAPNRFREFLVRVGFKKIPVFVLGILTSLVPCPPLSAILLKASSVGSVSMGSIYGLIYGSGLIISPIIIMGGFFGYLSDSITTEVPHLKGFVKILSSAVICFMGIKTMC
ncbi:MAG: sulfite exporter TauE/SafE family protein [Proteobacteria bacterium]|nr:sulfite exporter TauE/SafE family protein [Pseudomonadota bacterium]